MDMRTAGEQFQFAFGELWGRRLAVDDLLKLFSAAGDFGAVKTLIEARERLSAEYEAALPVLQRKYEDGLAEEMNLTHGTIS